MTKYKINGVFVPHMVEMIRSPAFAALSLSDRHMLDRLEIEHADHGGKDNGGLICTYRDFQHFGIDSHAIAPSLNALEALGFIAIARYGFAVDSVGRPPNRYRLTYLSTADGGPTDEWQKITTDEQARTVAKTARATAGKKPKSRLGKPQSNSLGKPQSNPQSHRQNGRNHMTGKTTVTI